MSVYALYFKTIYTEHCINSKEENDGTSMDIKMSNPFEMDSRTILVIFYILN